MHVPNVSNVTYICDVDCSLTIPFLGLSAPEKHSDPCGTMLQQSRNASQHNGKDDGHQSSGVFWPRPLPRGNSYFCMNGDRPARPKDDWTERDSKWRTEKWHKLWWFGHDVECLKNNYVGVRDIYTAELHDSFTLHTWRPSLDMYVQAP